MRHFSRSLVYVGLLLIAAACSNGDKIGSTVKGTRIAVMDQAKTITADPGAQSVKPNLPGVTANRNWPQAGYDSVHVMPNADVVSHPKEVWSASIGEGSDSDFKLLARPVANNGIVFTMDAQGLVRAFDAKTGNRKWEFDTTPEDRDGNTIGGGVGADGNVVYATTGFGEVLALNAETGKVIWRKMLMNPIRAAPTIAENCVYVVSINNRLTALNVTNGEELWHHDGITENATLMGASNPAVTGDSVVVAYSSGEIYNLRTENGRSSWIYALTNATQVGALPAIADIRGLPVIDHDRVFAVSHAGRMAAIEHRTGDRVWEADVGSINTPVVAGDAVFVLSNEGQIVAMSRESGRILWVHELQHLSDPDDKDSDPVFWTGPVLGGGRLWLTNSLGQLASLSPDDGKAGDVIDIGEPVYISPVIAGSMMYVVRDDGRIVALR
jgi:outer membrane protein assembly factor BamB